MVLIKILILAAFIRLLVNHGKPFRCAGIYTAVGFALSLLGPTNLLILVLSTAVRFALASLYFWLLDRFGDNLLIFWVVAILGVVIGFV